LKIPAWISMARVPVTGQLVRVWITDNGSGASDFTPHSELAIYSDNKFMTYADEVIEPVAWVPHTEVQPPPQSFRAPEPEKHYSVWLPITGTVEMRIQAKDRDSAVAKAKADYDTDVPNAGVRWDIDGDKFDVKDVYVEEFVPMKID